MKNAVVSILVCSALLSGCAVAKSVNEAGAKNNSVSSVAAPGVVDRLHAIKFVGQDYIDGKDVPISVKVGNGFTSALVQDEPAKITRKNPNFYEVKGSGYIVSIALDDTGVISASWNEDKRGSRNHGGLSVVKGE
ncbi:hypothetical protein [Enterobacter pseudoroggenkampii]|uniref:hypothetical protein n=1 Tax=Enterobacter pseudoroggenkampii TaxID=2996112 RepID=UPI00226557F4|nr:hypothetical protein [Enterobacter pseudoroggenkampii]MCX8289094.1 hypothetical protein [Enterobacter pseudoroggenkampii]